ncbi:MAG: hypothetical protein ACRC53_01025 [Plesiomonas sp.]|uniref:hypothetical protein n=1 Tax=Plesiomonas sp. TaxID=2486279 RepID=UPI003F3110DA
MPKVQPLISEQIRAIRKTGTPRLTRITIKRYIEHAVLIAMVWKKRENAKLRDEMALSS